MSTLLGRALTRLTFTACTLVVLAAIGQPIASPSFAPTGVLQKIDGLPLAATLLQVVGNETADSAVCAVEPINFGPSNVEASNAEVGKQAAAAALARSALRMRWLLTSPSASNRGCVAAECAG